LWRIASESSVDTIRAAFASRHSAGPRRTVKLARTQSAHTGPCAACVGSVALRVVRNVRTSADSWVLDGEAPVMVRNCTMALLMRMCAAENGTAVHPVASPPSAWHAWVRSARDGAVRLARMGAMILANAGTKLAGWYTVRSWTAWKKSEEH
jgi:hypothetical protein